MSDVGAQNFVPNRLERMLQPTSNNGDLPPHTIEVRIPIQEIDYVWGGEHGEKD